MSGARENRLEEQAPVDHLFISAHMIAPGHAKTPATAKRIETDHLDVTSYVSDEVVAPGSLFSVAFDVKPNAGIHVYASGAKDYRVISFRHSR